MTADAAINLAVRFLVALGAPNASVDAPGATRFALPSSAARRPGRAGPHRPRRGLGRPRGANAAPMVALDQ